MKSWHSQSCPIKLCLATVALSPAINLFFLYFRYLLIEINQNRSKSIITKNCVIDFYRHLIFVDWLVSNLIDSDWLLSTIEIINMLRPAICYQIGFDCQIFTKNAVFDRFISFLSEMMLKGPKVCFNSYLVNAQLSQNLNKK